MSSVLLASSIQLLRYVTPALLYLSAELALAASCRSFTLRRTSLLCAVFRKQFLDEFVAFLLLGFLCRKSLFNSCILTCTAMLRCWQFITKQLSYPTTYICTNRLIRFLRSILNHCLQFHRHCENNAAVLVLFSRTIGSARCRLTRFSHQS